MASLTVRGHVIGRDREDAQAKARQILSLCRPGANEPRRIGFSDRPGIEWLGHLDATSTRQDQGKGWNTAVITLNLVFSAPDPRARSTDPTTVHVQSSTRRHLDLGDAPSELVITIPSPDPTVLVELTDVSGQPIDQLLWADTGETGELEIDGGECTIVQGVERKNVLGGLDPSSVLPLIADPARGIAAIRVSGGDSIVTYHRRWWS